MGSKIAREQAFLHLLQLGLQLCVESGQFLGILMDRPYTRRLNVRLAQWLGVNFSRGPDLAATGQVRLLANCWQEEQKQEQWD